MLMGLFFPTVKQESTRVFLIWSDEARNADTVFVSQAEDIISH